jgi:hypothetical protein
MAEKKDAGKTGKLVVNVSLPKSEPGKPAPATRVYLFDAADRLVHSEPAREQVEFSVDLAQRYRVTAGPDLIVKEQPAPPALVQKLAASSAVSQDYLPQRANTNIKLAVDATTVALWLMRCINVHGSVRKLLNPGGSPPQYASICTGTVQVFNIDLACSLDNLTNADLTNLKNTMLSRMLNVEIADIIRGDFGDAFSIGALAAGLIPLSGAALKSYIVANRAALAPFMCNIIPEWAICYTQLADAVIQSDGTFSNTYCFFFWETVDIYFEVVQTLDGNTREIADPDIMCTTMFNYDGTQPALITVTDPTAIACQPTNPGPGYLYVWPTAIGNIDLRNIDGIETLAGTGLTSDSSGRPVAWGGTLDLQMQFHPGLQAGGVVYYRWSYKFDGDSDFTQIGTPVTHRWQDITVDGFGIIHIHLNGYAFGPHPVGTQTNLFEIPDLVTKTWVDINDPLDRPFAYFDSTTGSTPGRSGMCTLKLEMFDGAGNHLPSGNDGHGGPFKFILPDLTMPPGSFKDATGPNIDGAGDLIFRVGVDNNPTKAALYDATTGSHGSGDACGMRHYSGPNDPVTIEYAATQPNNFIDWSLSVARGTCGQVVGKSDHTSSPDPANFTNNASVLLAAFGSCPGCIQAAFAVNLNCWARITDGYSRQSQYDRSATIAFALLTP